MSRRLRYQVAVSLDGFIAGPNGEHDWIVMDPAIDFAALFKEFDTAVMGRKTYAVLTAQGGNGAMPGLEVVVFSRTLRPAVHPGVRIVNEDPREVVTALKAKPGRDIWLYGGGECFRSLLDAGLVDTVEVAVVPVLLGSGVPLLPPGAATKLTLADQKTLSASGIVALSYSIPGGVGPAPRIRYVKAAKVQGDVHAVGDILRRIESAENSGDADGIGEMLAEDAVIMVPSQPVQEGRLACAAFVREMLSEVLQQFNRRITYTSAEVRIVGDMAFDRGTFSFTVSRRTGGEATRETGKYLFLYSRDADRVWKIARAIVTLDERDGEPGETLIGGGS